MTQQVFTIVIHRQRKRKEKKQYKIALIVIWILLLSSILIAFGMATAEPYNDKDYSQPVKYEKQFLPSVLPKTSHTEPVETEQTYNIDYDAVKRMAQALYGEARGVESKERQSAVIWCILNRVDDPRWPDTIEEVCIQSQFNGYDPNHPILPELYELTLDVYTRWIREKSGETNVGRTLPSEYVFFHGDGRENHFRTEYMDTGVYWDWSLENPYL